ncbi:MAG TPA: RNA 2',3'-cyclic phosphodiesterase [Pyrinomonadaceae bacterium]|nr:RNA 2',3'-cyclic phosphodiesterase [Pyrinomonadaceae bacterium]
MISNPHAPEKPWRVFCAVELPLDLRERMMDHVHELRSSIPNARASWNRIENLHLTVKFLGNVDTRRVDDILAAALQAAMSVAPFEIKVGGCGSFSQRGSPRVLWTGIDDLESGMKRLYQALEDAMEAIGFARESRPFHAHITIARIRVGDDNARRLAERHRELPFSPAVVKVNSLAVIRSILGTEGSRYITLADHKLGSN